MAGIIQQNLPQAAPMGAPQGAQPGTPGGSPSDRILAAALRILHDPSTSPQFVSMLRSGDPAEAVARVATTLVQAIVEKSKGKVTKQMILPVFKQIIDAVLELAKACGLPSVPPEAIMAAVQKLQGQGQQPAPAAPGAAPPQAAPPQAAPTAPPMGA